MGLLSLFGPRGSSIPPNKKKKRDRRLVRTSRLGKTATIDVTQDGNSVVVKDDDTIVHFSVEGIDLPREVDASFAVWGLLAAARRGASIFTSIGPSTQWSRLMPSA